MKVAFISMHPAPYRDALIGALINHFADTIDVYNLYDSDAGHRFWSLDKPEYMAECLTNDIGRASRLRIFLRLLRKFVFNSSYDCVIWPGYVEWPIRMAIILSALIRKKYVLSIDSVEQPAVSKITFVVKRWMIQRSDLVFVPGLASKKFMMEKFSVPESKIVCGAYALDGVALEKRIWELRKSGVCEKVRGKLGIKRDASVFLMVANMIPTRQYPITSAGFVEFAKEHEDCVFVMVGKGQDYAKMTRYVKDHACLRAIEGCSFDEMLELYAASDVYVHGGKEPASTALVIGAIAHLPLISSDAVGCSFDVLEDNGSGFMVRDYKSAHAWSETFTKAMNNADAWQGLGDKARTLSRKLDADKVAEEFARLLYLM